MSNLAVGLVAKAPSLGIQSEIPTLFVSRAIDKAVVDWVIVNVYAVDSTRPGRWKVFCCRIFCMLCVINHFIKTRVSSLRQLQPMAQDFTADTAGVCVGWNILASLL